jgi:multicomponent Na+:H+ antiporter subunit B
LTSLIFTTATNMLQPLLLLFSVYLLLSGHDEPGGGFTGGLVAAAAYTLHAIAYDVPSARRALRVRPQVLVGTGLLVALLSGLLAPLQEQPFMKSLWTKVPRPGLPPLEVGTPLLFDAGVFLVVMGFTLTVVLSLAEE